MVWQSELSAATLRMLVSELLLARTEGLSAPQMAAFVQGWSSVLELMRRVDLVFPDASAETKAAMQRFVDEIERARIEVLTDEDH